MNASATNPANSFLDRVLVRKREEVAAARARLPEERLESQAARRPPPPDFAAALTDPRFPAPRLIAEIKERSPSKGSLRPGLDPLALARDYALNGARAISVLTDEPFFGGSVRRLHAVADLGLGLPLLRKGFLLDRYQLLEARAAGASAALLIVAMLDDLRLVELIRLAEALSLTPLVEVHDERELERALQAGARVIGINNRDLRTFAVDTSTALRLASQAPEGTILVAESGLRKPEDLAAVANAGVHAVLVGEALVTAPDPAVATRRLARLRARQLTRTGDSGHDC